MQAQAKVLGAERSDPSGGRANFGAAARANTTASRWLPTGNGSWGIEQPSPSRTGEGQWVSMKVTGQCSRRLLRRIGGGTEGMVSDPKQGRSRDREARDTRRESRLRVTTRLADRVVVAMRPRESITLAEQRTRGAALRSMTRGRTRHARHVSGPTGDIRRVAKASAKGASNSVAWPTGKGVPEETVRCRCLEAVLGKTRRTEF